jgi:hypothetical protein
MGHYDGESYHSTISYFLTENSENDLEDENRYLRLALKTLVTAAESNSKEFLDHAIKEAKKLLK